MENTNNNNNSVLKTIADKSKRNKVSLIASGIVSLIVELLCYIIFGALVAIEVLPFESLVWKEILKVGEEIPLDASDLFVRTIVIVKLILGIIGLTFLFLGMVLRKVRNRNKTISEINKLAEEGLKTNQPLKKED